MRRREVEERRHRGGMRVTEKEKSKNLYPFGFCLHVLCLSSIPSLSFWLLLSPPPPSPSLWLPPQPLIVSLSLLLSVFLLGRAFHCVTIWG